MGRTPDLAPVLLSRRSKLNPKEVATPMKKLFTLLFAGALAVSLAMPVFAQDSSAASQEPSSTTMGKKEKKPKKAKKEKKPKKEKKSKEAPPPEQ